MLKFSSSKTVTKKVANLEVTDIQLSRARTDAREAAQQDLSSLAVLSVAVWVLVVPIALFVFLLPFYMWFGIALEGFGIALVLAYWGLISIPTGTNDKLTEMRINYYLIKNLESAASVRLSEHQ